MRVKVYVKKETPSKNLFNPKKLLAAISWKKDGYIYHGLSAYLHTLYNSADGTSIVTGFKDNTRYTLSLYGRIEEHESWNAGLFIHFLHTDGTKSNTMIIDSTTEKKYTLVSGFGKTVKGLYISYGWNIRNYLRDIQCEEGSTATEYEPYGNYQRVKVWNGKQSKNLWEIPYPRKGTSKGVTFTTRPDGGVHISGRAEHQAQITYLNWVHLKGEDKLIASLQSADGVKNVNVKIVYGGGSYQYGETVLNGERHMAISRVTSGFNMLYGYIRVEANTTVDMVVYPMIQAGDTVTDFEPYNQALMKVHVKE